jgi:hypothetical protein
MFYLLLLLTIHPPKRGRMAVNNEFCLFKAKSQKLQFAFQLLHGIQLLVTVVLMKQYIKRSVVTILMAETLLEIVAESGVVEVSSSQAAYARIVPPN